MNIISKKHTQHIWTMGIYFNSLLPYLDMIKYNYMAIFGHDSITHLSSPVAAVTAQKNVRTSQIKLLILV